MNAECGEVSSDALLTRPMCHVNVSHMKTTTIRQLRHDTTTVLSWVARGESVEVQRRGEAVAVLSLPVNVRRAL